MRIWCDSISAAALAHNPIFHSKTKHIEVDIYFIRDMVSKVKINCIPSKEQIADTKFHGTFQIHEKETQSPS